MMFLFWKEDLSISQFYMNHNLDILTGCEKCADYHATWFSKAYDAHMLPFCPLRAWQVTNRKVHPIG